MKHKIIKNEKTEKIIEIHVPREMVREELTVSTARSITPPPKSKSIELRSVMSRIGIC